MITLEEFQVAITALQQLMPMGKPLSPPALVLAWDTFPPFAKNQLTSESLDFAVKQRVMDPDPPKEQALHIALLRYVFPIRRTVKRERGQDVNCDEVLLEGGPRADLAQRMANPNRWHETAPAPYGQSSVSDRPRLPGGVSGWHPSQLSPEELQARVEQVAEEMQRIWAGGMDGRTWEPREMACGFFSFGKALQGFWPLEADTPASAWILRNPKQAAEMLGQARAGLLQATPAVDVVPITAVFGSLRAGQGVNPWR